MCDATLGFDAGSALERLALGLVSLMLMPA
jgi:hypothetical protein